MTLHSSFYRPPVHIHRYPRIEPCGTLISVEGQDDHICPAQVLKSTTSERCPECKARRKGLAVARHRRKARS